MGATIKTIAAAAGVSFQAVSAVLNNRGTCRVSAETRARILEIAGRQNYQRNFGYKLMHHQATDTVAILTRESQLHAQEYVPGLLLKLFEKLNELGYATYFSDLMSGDEARNLEQVRILSGRGAEHFIFIGEPAGWPRIQAELEQSHHTYIGFKAELPRTLGIDSITPSRKILEFFQSEVGEKFKILTPPHSFRFAALKELYPGTAPEELARRFVVPHDPVSPGTADYSREMFDIGYARTGQTMERYPETRAIFYLSDYFALGGAAYLTAHGLRVGRDVLLAGYNNIDAVRFHPFPISSAEHPVQEIVDTLVREMRSTAPFHHFIPTIVHIRTEKGSAL